MKLYFSILILVICNCFFKNVNSEATPLNDHNIDQILASNDIVFVNFYANWCRFSQMLQPIYDEFADKFVKENPGAKVAIAKVDCDAEVNIATRFHINKYPTLKLFRYGTMTKREYRGARSVDAFLGYIKEQMADTVQKLQTIYQVNEIDFVKKPTLLGYFEKEDSDNYNVYKKLANLLRDSCHFLAVIGDASSSQRQNGDKIIYRTVKAGIPEDAEYSHELNNYDQLYSWANEKCTKLVREITFENAEELTEEGLPFLILFHKPEDQESLVTFEREVARQLIHEKNTINAVYADGHKFTHPLHHLGKTVSDLPILAIDSFRHMYLFPDFKKISANNALKQFVLDLHSGKLHREFHNGPDPTEAPKIEATVSSDGGASTDSVHLPKTSEDTQQNNNNQPSTPPESVFKKLQPSNIRYTLKDEF